ncbi:MAG: cytoskeletal protein CcmA (bactofilin family) [Sulfurimonas sp.]|jgi:cytoskeletal protein CcmA (bactofilin family)|uniref:bactofilin family protein n=1 Tax=Sulfurimonas sp. TaxID=2022749 RepID=UPI0039E5C396
MTLTCNLYVDGDFEGSINSKNEVNVGKHGHIKGDLITKRLVVQGYVEGTINAEIVEIKSAGRVSGTIESAELVIESKGVFEGNSIVKDIESAPTKKKIDLAKS